MNVALALEVTSGEYDVVWFMYPEVDDMLVGVKVP